MLKSKITWVLFTVIGFIILLSNFKYSDSSSLYPPHPFRSGGPGDTGGGGMLNYHCGSTCHTSYDAVFKSNRITSDIPLSGYMPNQNYTVTVSINSPGSRYGFQSSVQDDNGNFHGKILQNDSTWLRVDSFNANNIKYWIMHLDSMNAVKNGKDYWLGYKGTDYDPHFKAWSFEWIAPDAGAGTVTIYACFVTGNDDGTHQNDSVFLSSLTVNEAATSVVNDENYNNYKIELYPNPFNTVTTLKTNWHMFNAGLIVYDKFGKTVFAQNDLYGFNFNFERNNLPSGLYIIKIIERDKILRNKLLIID